MNYRMEKAEKAEPRSPARSSTPNRSKEGCYE
jgi:hypothetical protein